MLLCLCSNLLFSKYRNLHSSMFENVLKSTMRFFHVSPIGRILNRFSSDMALVDEQMNKAMGSVSLVSYRDAIDIKVYNTVYLYTISDSTTVYSIGFSHMHMSATCNIGCHSGLPALHICQTVFYSSRKVLTSIYGVEQNIMVLGYKNKYIKNVRCPL